VVGGEVSLIEELLLRPSGIEVQARFM
jgi:hypothetical protein